MILPSHYNTHKNGSLKMYQILTKYFSLKSLWKAVFEPQQCSLASLNKNVLENNEVILNSNLNNHITYL